MKSRASKKPELELVKANILSSKIDNIDDDSKSITSYAKMIRFPFSTATIGRKLKKSALKLNIFSVPSSTASSSNSDARNKTIVDSPNGLKIDDVDIKRNIDLLYRTL